MAPGHLQAGPERRERQRPFRTGRLGRDELDRALERRESGVIAAGCVGIHPEAHVQQRRTGRVLIPGELDGSPCELDRAWRRTGLAGELGGPGAQLGEVEPGEPGRVGHGGPQRERPLQVSSGLRQAEQGLRLACRFDRGGQRLRAATRGRPVRRELRR